MTQFTLGFDNKSYASNGDVLFNVTNVEDLKVIPSALNTISDKNKLPGLYVYSGIKGKWHSSNIVFLDIDTTECVDTIISSANELFTIVPDIIAIQKSYSGKLHIIAFLDNKYYDEVEWRNAAAFMTAYIAQVIKVKFNVDYYSLGYLDDHNLKWNQKLYVSANNFIVNDEILPGYSEATIIEYQHQLTEYYSNLFVNVHIQRKSNTFTNINTNEFISNECKNKLKIDKNVFAGNYNGNELRWRIARIARGLFGENAKQWCDERFYCENGKSIFTESSVADAGNYSSVVMNWLIENGYISRVVEDKDIYKLSNIKDDNKLEVKTFLTEEYYDLVKYEIEQNNVLSIVSGTGTGKTKLINELAGELKSVIITPFNAMKQLYDGKLVDRIEHNLFGVERIKSVKTIQNVKASDYTGEESCVMVYDQLVKVKDELLYDKVIFVDECHVMYINQDFRNALIKLIDKLYAIKDKCKIVLVSATPLNEIDILKADKTLHFFKNRRMINTNFINFKSINTRRTYIERIMNMSLQKMNQGYTSKYNRIVLFSDSITRNVYYNLLTEYNESQVGILHTKFPEELEEIKISEQLTKPIYLCTSVAFNGLNFKNENERVLIYVDYNYGEDLAWKIIQCAGRFRNSNVDLYICTTENDIVDVSSKVALNNVKYELDLQSIGVDYKLLDERYVKIMKGIQKYTLDNTYRLKDCLIEQGYFNILNDIDYDEIVKTQNKLNIKIDKMFKELLVNYNNKIKIDTFIGEYNESLGKEEFNLLKQAICNCWYNYMIRDIATIHNTMLKTNIDKFDTLNKVIDDGTSKVRERIEDINKYILLSDDLYVKDGLKKAKSKLEKYVEIAGYDIDDRPGLYKLFGGKDKYIECKKRNAGKRLLKELQEKDKEVSANRAEGRTKGGKNGSRAKKTWVRNLETNETAVFDNSKEAMNFIGCSSRIFAKLIKGEQSKKFKYSVRSVN